MLLAKPFHLDSDFNFGQQTITRDIQALSGLMLRERLCPPPPEVYSLHRKLSGLFLLAGKLEANFNCHVIWCDIRASFRPFPEAGSAGS
jgi:aarF domain-containing kinase